MLCWEQPPVRPPAITVNSLSPAQLAYPMEICRSRPKYSTTPDAKVSLFQAPPLPPPRAHL